MIDEKLKRQARQSDLVAYLISRGEPLKRVGKNYIHQQHDSLYIKDNMFIWYSKGIKGNSIDFLIQFYGMTFNEAVAELTKTELRTFTKSTSTPQKRLQQPQRATDERRVIAYLCKKRGLNYSLVKSLIAQGKLQQDTNGNCNFIICDWNEQPIGFEIVGTGDVRYKQITSHGCFGFHLLCGLNPTEALYFESSIDLLSCYQIYQEKFTHHILISLGGLNNNIVYEMNRLYPYLNHWLCVDNDISGNEFILHIKQNMAKVRIFRPQRDYKDWNDQLRQQKI